MSHSASRHTACQSRLNLCFYPNMSLIMMTNVLNRMSTPAQCATDKARVRQADMSRRQQRIAVHRWFASRTVCAWQELVLTAKVLDGMDSPYDGHLQRIRFPHLRKTPAVCGQCVGGGRRMSREAFN
jgi:hypothetical protein